jgi:hypothetical protein
MDTRAYVALAAATALAGCKVERAAQAAERGVKLDSARAVSRATSVGTAPMYAVSPKGAEAVAWVSAPDSGSDGRLYVSVDGGDAPAELRDPLGSIQVHGEAPPKLAYAPDGATLGALYVVGKEVPGRRFPLSALRFARSPDGGRTWEPPATVTDDTAAFGSHNFHSLHAAADGAVYAAWLDGRQGKSAVYVARSADGGRTWARNVRADAGEACPCCRTAIATSPDGKTVYLAWRGVLAGNVRDVVVARSGDGGQTWDAPVRVHADGWVFDGCPHAGPALQVDTAGRVHVAWWTGTEGAAGVYYARSDDGARTFGPPVPLGVAGFSRPAHAQLALAPGGATVVAAWDDGTAKVPRVVMRVSHDGGSTFSPAVALSAAGRAAGYPVVGLARDGRRVTVAWSEQSPESVAAHAAGHPDMKDPRAVQKLHPVGDAQVLVRRGEL